jgi:hypothetical protein
MRITCWLSDGVGNTILLIKKDLGTRHNFQPGKYMSEFSPSFANVLLEMYRIGAAVHTEERPQMTLQWEIHTYGTASYISHDRCLS